MKSTKNHFRIVIKVTAIWKFIFLQLLGNGLFLFAGEDCACGLFSVVSTFKALLISHLLHVLLFPKHLFSLLFSFSNTIVLLWQQSRPKYFAVRHANDVTLFVHKKTFLIENNKELTNSY